MASSPRVPFSTRWSSAWTMRVPPQKSSWDARRSTRIHSAPGMYTLMQQSTRDKD